jgi:hypothetical protein
LPAGLCIWFAILRAAAGRSRQGSGCSTGDSCSLWAIHTACPEYAPNAGKTKAAAIKLRHGRLDLF